MDERSRPLLAALVRATRDAAIVVCVASAVALVFNAVRSNGIPLVQREPYQLLVPCPDGGGEIGELAPDDPRLGEATTLVLDAREAEEFRVWHLPGARNIPYDFLDPIPERAVSEVLASGAHLVAVYGDGGDPDSGRELARELSGKGVRNVFAVVGGAPALRKEVRP